MNIDWTQQPTDKHLALIVTHNSKLIWVVEGGDSYIQCFSAYPKHAEGMLYTIHHKPTATPYQPEVGKWCDYANAEKRTKNGPLFFVGVNQEGELIFSDTYKHLFALSQGEILQAIKTERELFIEESVDKCIGALGDQLERICRTMAGVQYDNGARFK